MNGIDITDYIMGLISLWPLSFLYINVNILGWVLELIFIWSHYPIGFGSILALLFFIFYKIINLYYGTDKAK
jgi:hypothetical protein